MKNFVFFMIAFMFFACNQSASRYQGLEKKIDSLQSKLDNSYKPGLGEFMSQIQIHHAKLWFAGKYKNWELAGFEVGEIQEALDDIPKYCADRPEVKSISIVIPAMDSLSRAIKEKNENKFHFIVLDTPEGRINLLPTVVLLNKPKLQIFINN